MFKYAILNSMKSNPTARSNDMSATPEQNDWVTSTLANGVLVQTGESRMSIVEDRRGTRWQVRVDDLTVIGREVTEDGGADLGNVYFGIGYDEDGNRIEVAVEATSSTIGTDLSKYLCEERGLDYRGTFIPA